MQSMTAYTHSLTITMDPNADISCKLLYIYVYKGFRLLSYVKIEIVFVIACFYFIINPKISYTWCREILCTFSISENGFNKYKKDVIHENTFYLNCW